MIRQGTKLTVYGETDVGQIREHNEDFIGWDAHLGLILLADGMGGHQAGEVASQLALEVVQEELSEVLSPQGKAMGPADYRLAVLDAVHKANRDIFRLCHLGIFVCCRCGFISRSLSFAVYFD